MAKVVVTVSLKCLGNNSVRIISGILDKKSPNYFAMLTPDIIPLLTGIAFELDYLDEKKKRVTKSPRSKR